MNSDPLQQEADVNNRQASEESDSPGIISLVITKIISDPIDRLIEFLESNARIFTIAGVFAALSVYARRSSSNSRGEFASGEFGFVSGLTVVIVISIPIYYKLISKSREGGIILRWENSGLFLFGIFFTLLLSSIYYQISGYSSVWGPLYAGLAIVAGELSAFGVNAGMLTMASGLHDKYKIDKKLSSVLLLIILCLLGVFLTTTQLFDADVLSNLGESIPKSVVIHIFSTYLIGISVAISFLGTSLIAMYTVLRKLRDIFIEISLL